MIALVCDTPYQLISAILVAEQVAPDAEMVFFINRYLYFKEQDFDYCARHPIVHKILYYGKKHMAPTRLLGGLLRPNTMLRQVEGYQKDMRFDAIITSRTTYMATYLYNEQVKYCAQLPVYLVEEGIGEYTNQLLDTRFTKMLSRLRQPTHMDHITKAFFSAPQLYPYKLPFSVEKVPALTSVSQDIIESMFDLEKLSKGGNLLSDYPAIFLSEPNSAGIRDKAKAELYDSQEHAIMDALARAIGRDQMIIKVHPLDPTFKKEGIRTYDTKFPMESLLLTMDCESKLFISSMSTAMLTPKLLFDFEPALLFTYKILDPYIQLLIPHQSQRQRYYQFIEGVMGMYRDQSKVYAPRSQAELESRVADFIKQHNG